jgi:hypothetical protein
MRRGFGMPGGDRSVLYLLIGAGQENVHDVRLAVGSRGSGPGFRGSQQGLRICLSGSVSYLRLAVSSFITVSVDGLSMRLTELKHLS